VNTDSCQVGHIGCVVSGTLHVQHDDGTEEDVSAVQVYGIQPGHDGWNAGTEPVVCIEFQGATNYAKP
jgi:hypothetical protein